MPQIVGLRRYPLKGAASIPHRQLMVNTTVGVVGDRVLALRQREGGLTERPDPFNKLDYLVCANTPAIAQYRPHLIADGRACELHEAHLALLQERFGPFSLQDTNGEYHLGDTAGAQVSFINLATVRALNEHVGAAIDPERFRMNVQFDGLPAFEEYEWVNGYPGTREIRVGTVRMRVDDAAERCKATHANPQTGIYDMPMMSTLRDFMEARGYKSPHRSTPCVMGFYGVVLERGIISVGDEITPI